MSTGGRIFLGIVKWIAVPVALAAVGYYVIGPKFNAAPALPKIGATDPMDSAVAQTTEEPRAASKFGEPNVEVSVTSSQTRRLRGESMDGERRRETPRRERTRTAPREEKKSEQPTSVESAGDAPPADEGSVGGTMPEGSPQEAPADPPETPTTDPETANGQ